MHRLLPALTALLLLALPARAQSTDVAPPVADPGSTPTLYDAPEIVADYAATITPEDLAGHLFFFASDEFEGRETAAPGQKLAAKYLAGQYRRIGAQPAGMAESDHRYAPSAYYQPVPLYGQRITSTRLEAKLDGRTVASTVYGREETDGHSYLMFGSDPSTEGGIVFGGYGISDSDAGYDDYAALSDAGIELSDSWLMIMAGEPRSADGRSRLTDDGSASNWSTARFAKLRNLLGMSELPKGLLVVGDAEDGSSPVADAAVSRAEGLAGVGSLSLEDPSASEGHGQIPPVFVISKSFADELLSAGGRSFAEVKASIDTSGDPHVFELGDLSLTGSINNEVYETSSENVVAVIEGSDPELKDQYIVVSSHYDHIGVGTGEGDVINNGADDDGSGTVTVLEIAEAFEAARRDGYGPRRSIIFLNVTGEEKGLLGSAWYTDHQPIVPLEQTVTNLNIDMIGRIDPTHPGETSDYVYIIGSKLISTELHDINVRSNELIGADLDLNERFNSKDDPNQFYARSDHWNFGKHGIPFIFFFTGTHEDYHGVDDEPEKIEYERMADIARVIFATAWQVANQDNPPAVTGEGFN